MKNKTEIVKRLTPKSSTLRELYLLSGNRCAFPECTEAIVREDGSLVGDVCHIEAAMPEGERFNENMTNEKRRHISNLILLCKIHHAVTNNVELYPVEKMREMKQKHEDLYKDIAGRMKYSIVNYSKSTEPKKAINGKRINAILSLNLNENDLKTTLDALNEMIDLLYTVPLSTRKLFGIMIMKSFERGISEFYIVPIDEVLNDTGIDIQSCSVHVDSLKRRKFVSEIEFNTDNLCRECYLYGHNGWNYWDLVQGFCNISGEDIDRIVLDLDNSVFDE